MIINIPSIKCFVDRRIVAGKEGFDDCYIFAVTALLNRSFLFTCHTNRGAVYSRLPISAFYHHTVGKHRLLFQRDMDTWGCLGNDIGCIEHGHLKDYSVEIPHLKMMGKYLFTLDSFHGGLAQDPEQHKTSNFIELENGQYGIFPNNFLKFIDSHFFDKDKPCDYRRNNIYWK